MLRLSLSVASVLALPFVMMTQIYIGIACARSEIAFAKQRIEPYHLAYMEPINIVLHEPEIPQNTGNIARTCAAIGARLHLIKPLGFSLEDKYMKRAGLDYWDKLDVLVYESLDDFFSRNEGVLIYFYSKKAAHTYTGVPYPEGVYLMFGKETKGLPEELILANFDHSVRIPMREGLRSLNLSNAVAVGAYEALRQQGFASLCLKGKFKERG